MAAARDANLAGDLSRLPRRRGHGSHAMQLAAAGGHRDRTFAPPFPQICPPDIRSPELTIADVRSVVRISVWEY